MIVGQNGEPPLRRGGNAPFAPLCPPGFLGVPVIAGHSWRISPRMTRDPGRDPAGRRHDHVICETRHAAAYQGLALMLADGAGNERSELHESCVHMSDLTEKLTARARDAGVIRGGVTGADVSALVSAEAWTAERTSAEDADRLVDLAFDGLRQPTGS
jgi:hypothetical protein